jgi:hypothetical protein
MHEPCGSPAEKPGFATTIIGEVAPAPKCLLLRKSRQPRQQKCRRCGSSIGDTFGNCRVSDADWRELVAYAKEFGRVWRSRLLARWQSGNDEGWQRRIRNVVGPASLYWIKPEVAR